MDYGAIGQGAVSDSSIAYGTKLQALGRLKPIAYSTIANSQDPTAHSTIAISLEYYSYRTIAYSTMANSV